VHEKGKATGSAKSIVMAHRADDATLLGNSKALLTLDSYVANKMLLYSYDCCVVEFWARKSRGDKDRN